MERDATTAKAAHAAKQLASSATARGDGAVAQSERGGEPADMFGDVSAAMRMQMELVACASTTPEAALPDVVALLVVGPRAKRDAIVDAISTNVPLREQWERTWRVLRR